jgi:hypothetical protein
MSGGGAALHEALEVGRRVLAAEIHAALRRSFVADLPVRVAVVEQRRLVRERLRRFLVPLQTE